MRVRGCTGEAWQGVAIGRVGWSAVRDARGADAAMAGRRLFIMHDRQVSA